MTIRKLFGMGTIALSVYAFLTTRNDKASMPTALYYSAGVGVCRQLASSLTITSNRLTTTGIYACPVKIATYDCVYRFLYATSSCVKKVYFMP
jgi:hypothetical protein